MKFMHTMFGDMPLEPSASEICGSYCFLQKESATDLEMEKNFENDPKYIGKIFKILDTFQKRAMTKDDLSDDLKEMYNNSKSLVAVIARFVERNYIFLPVDKYSTYNEGIYIKYKRRFIKVRWKIGIIANCCLKFAYIIEIAEESDAKEGILIDYEDILNKKNMPGKEEKDIKVKNMLSSIDAALGENISKDMLLEIINKHIFQNDCSYNTNNFWDFYA